MCQLLKTILAIFALFVAAGSAAATDYCESASSDPDNDGWGYENSKSCIVKVEDTCNYNNADLFDGWGWDSVNSKSCPPKESDTDTCDYRNSALHDGWGWDPVNRMSCAPLDANTTDTCDYALADLYDGWGWDPIAKASCPPADGNLCVDQDGDGWGWDGEKTCPVVSFELTLFDPPGNHIPFNTSMSDDARHVLYRTSANSDSAIRLLDTETGEAPYLTANQNDYSGDVSDLTSDGKYAVYSTYDLDFMQPGLSSDKLQTVLFNSETSEYELISENRDGSLGNASPERSLSNRHTYGGRVSENGKSVVFYGSSSNLTPYDYNGELDIFIRDVPNRKTTLVTNGWTGDSSNGSSYLYDMSPDGRYIVIFTRATNLVRDYEKGSELVIYDALEQEFIDVPLPEDTDPSGRPYGASIASDGSKLVFSYGFDAHGSEIHLFDINTNLTKVIANKNSSDQYYISGRSRYPSLSSDGKYVVFDSDNRNLQSEITVTTDRTQVYLYDLYTDETTLISRAFNNREEGHDASYRAYFTPNDSHIFFNSLALNLTPDEVRYANLYLYDMSQHGQ